MCRFGDFLLDAPNRQLWRGEDRVDLNARYFDALVLLVREHGQLVEKDRFFAEVWYDVVVSDSALTQCIKDVRKQLGDDATNPRYIETVPRYGYRFIGPIEAVPPESPPPVAPIAVAPTPRAETVLPPEPDDPTDSGRSTRHTGRPPLEMAALWSGSGALGGGFAGMLGGLLYGSALAYTPTDSGLGTASILLVLLSLNVLMGLLGGFGVSVGMVAGGWVMRRPWGWSIAGAALGGLIVGGGVKLVGVDAFNLLFGRAPSGITGGLEGAALGAALALGARLGGGSDAALRWRPVIGAGTAAAIAGALITVGGGHLMGGSLELLARSFDGSRLQLDALGRFFGEVHFGHTTQVMLGGLEGLLFGSCVAGALVLARRVWPQSPQ